MSSGDGSEGRKEGKLSQPTHVLLKVTYREVSWQRGSLREAIRPWGADTVSLSFSYCCRDSRTRKLQGGPSCFGMEIPAEWYFSPHSVYTCFCIVLYVWELWKCAFQNSLQQRIYFKDIIKLTASSSCTSGSTTMFTLR